MTAVLATKHFYRWGLGDIASPYPSKRLLVSPDALLHSPDSKEIAYSIRQNPNRERELNRAMVDLEFKACPKKYVDLTPKIKFTLTISRMF